ncbi:Alpha/Beta hydrolase protein [Paraphoma chrysanthemicola]|uniref:Alpha/Beta hydrolase protein n=1 Tax=Paraphoma chrysanthemicola TaxID=798071 RepID=A0A8K0QYU6_9PLEO|nr:Alpha/Beta hydrolase protein [Paraphoma chrysanthemicola]
MFESLEKAHYVTKENGSIRVTDRHDRSQLMAVVQFLVRRFRNQINSGDPKHEDGSVKLDPPKSKLRDCTVSERTVCDIHIYDILAPNKTSQHSKRRIYYFAGGSWQMKPSGQHWSLCAKLATELPDTIVSMVSMPIAPNNPAPSSFPWCLKLYRALMAEAQEAGDKVILAGDSSGANVVFCLTLEALREDAESTLGVTAKQTSNSHPVALMGISPSTDLTRNNPDIDKIAKHDPLLTPDVIKQTARAWHADWDPADSKVSPINADISLLAKRGIKVHGVTAGSDVLAPDGVIFRNRCAENNVEGEWLHWEKQMHCFVLTLPYGLREAKEGVQWIIDVLRKE